MHTLWPQVERLLLGVAKPARYIGGEQGAQYPEHGPGKVAWMLIYPDTYEIGLPNQGLQILYEILNERPDAVAERAYAPWVDMEAAMRDAGVPLFSVEQHVAAADFDVLAFNLSAELVYTNVLNLIDLAAVPLHSGRPRARGPLGDRRGPLHLQSRAPGGLRRRLRPGRRGRDRRGGQRRHGGVAGTGRRGSGTARSCAWRSPGSTGSTCRPSTPRPIATGGWSPPSRTGPASRPTWPSGR